MRARRPPATGRRRRGIWPAPVAPPPLSQSRGDPPPGTGARAKPPAWGVRGDRRAGPADRPRSRARPQARSRPAASGHRRARATARVRSGGSRSRDAAGSGAASSAECPRAGARPRRSGAVRGAAHPRRGRAPARPPCRRRGAPRDRARCRCAGRRSGSRAGRAPRPAARSRRRRRRRRPGYPCGPGRPARPAGCRADRPRSTRGRDSRSNLLPDLHRDLVDRQRDRRLRLRGLHAHRLRREALDQALGDGRAEALQRLVLALLGRQCHLLAHHAVVDRVLHAIGDRRVALVELEGDVENEPLADLPLGLAHPVARVEGQARDFDRHRGRGAGAVVLELVVVLEVVPVLAIPGHLVTVAAATVRASRTGATSCTRKTLAPRSNANTLVAMVPGNRSPSGRPPASLPRKLLREVPTTTGRPIATISSRRRSSSRLCATVLPKPMPGSSHTRSSGTPWPIAKASRSSRNAFTSETTSS